MVVWVVTAKFSNNIGGLVMLRAIAVLAFVVGSVGCGKTTAPASRASTDLSHESTAGNELTQLGLAAESYSSNESAYNVASDEDSSAAAGNRKIIYTASLSIVVDDFANVEQSISGLVNSYGGFIASANVSLNQGNQPSGTWTVRIPVASFESFLDASGDLGVPERREQHGQDVTEEFVDVEARIKSKKQLEERILELLADNKGEIKDVIEVERELSRVRTEIEQMEGRLRYLADRTQLTTVTLNVREEQDYTPPQAPGFGSRIATTWNGSTGTIVAAAQNLLLALVACTPWLLLAGVVAVPVWRMRRRSLHQIDEASLAN